MPNDEGLPICGSCDDQELKPLERAPDAATRDGEEEEEALRELVAVKA